MTSTHTRLDTRWLATAEAEGTPAAEAGSSRWAEPWPEGQVERLELDLGAHLCRVAHRFTSGQTGLRPLSEVRAELAEPVLFVQVTHQGRGVLQDRRLDMRLSHAPCTALFLHLDRIDHVHWAESAAPLEITALVMSLSRLRRFIGAEAARELLAALALANRPAASRRSLPASIAAILKASLSESLTGPLRQLQAQAQAQSWVLDFLVALTGLINGLAPPVAHQRARLERVRAELDRCPGQAPDLGALARRHGFTARALNDGFKREFGQTVRAYVADRRLEAAHAVLLDTPVPLKVLAARLGYASASHFSQDFTQKFGYRPGRLRRQGPGEDDGW